IDHPPPWDSTPPAAPHPSGSCQAPPSLRLHRGLPDPCLVAVTLTRWFSVSTSGSTTICSAAV
ncbi:hypothetical protein M9458_037671, partial [Cirrhinus mrigala]